MMRPLARALLACLAPIVAACTPLDDARDLFDATRGPTQAPALHAWAPVAIPGEPTVPPPPPEPTCEEKGGTCSNAWEGWDGPYPVVVTDGPADPAACPKGTEPIELGSRFDMAPAECSPCACDPSPVEPTACRLGSAPGDYHVHAITATHPHIVNNPCITQYALDCGGISGNSSSLDVPTGPDGICAPAGSSSWLNQAMALDVNAITSTVFGSDACAGKASGGEVLNPLAPTRSAVACMPSSAKPTGGTCAGGEQARCLPHVPQARACVSRPLHPSEGFEGGACPSNYPDKLVHYRTVQDRRGCTACTCSGDGSCSVTMQAFAQDVSPGETFAPCSGEPLTGDLYLQGDNYPAVQDTDTITIGPGPHVACWNHGVFPNAAPWYNYRYTGVRLMAKADPMTCTTGEPSTPYVSPLPSNPAGATATTLQTDAVLLCCTSSDPPADP